MLVAITGRSGCGKSLISQYYVSCGYKVLDCDKIARKVLLEDSEVLAQLVQVFGKDILDESGCIMPKVLGAKAFMEQDGAQKLTAITHPKIIQQLLTLIGEHKGELVFVDGAVIIGEGFEKYCDKFIVLTARRIDSISRIVLRDGISRQAAENRLSAQKPQAQLKAKADYIIENNGNKEQLVEQAKQILALLEQDAK